MDDLTAWDQEVCRYADVSRIESNELSIRRTLARIDRALDVGNRRMFMELAGLLRDYKAKR
jgi:IS1 family transposase